MLSCAALAGCDVWSAQAAEHDQSTPYELIASTLRQDRKLFAHDFVGNKPKATSGATRFGPEVERFSVVEEIIEVVESQCQTATVFLVEDLHWADGPSLEALAMIARIALTHPLVLVITHRSGHTNHPLNRLAAETDRLGSTAVAVPPLSPGEIDAMVDSLAGGPASRALKARAQGAAGNPFLVQELVDGLLAEGRLVQQGDEVHADSLDLPEQLRRSVATELSGLGEETITVVRAASVQGSQIDVRDLALQLNEPIVNLAAPIESAVDAGLLTEDGRILRFRHDLMRDAVYQQMPAVIRSASHRDLAAVLGRRDATPALVASHLLLAGGDQPDELYYLQAAATQTAPLAPEAALTFLDRARDLVGDDLDTRRVIEVARLEALTAAGRISEAESVAYWLLEVSPGEKQSELLARLAGLALIAGDGERALGFGEQAIERAVDDRQRSRWLGLTAVTQATNRNYLQAWSLAQQAVELGESVDERVGQSIGLALVARMSTYANAVQEGLRLGAQAVAIADTDASGEAHAWIPCLHYGMTAFEVDKLEIAEEMVRRGNELAVSHRMNWALPLFATLQAACHFRRGDLDLAGAEAETAVEQAERMNSRQTIAWAQAILALVTLEIGSLDEARSWAGAADASWATGQTSLGGNYLALARARVTVAEGDLATALAELCRDWDDLEAEGLTFCHPLLATDLAFLARQLGNDRRFADAVSSLEAAAQINGVLAIDASGRWLRAVESGNPAEARAAIERMRLSDRRFELASWLLAYPELAAANGEPASALEEALGTFREVGATRSATSASAALGELGAEAGSIDNSWDALTPTELEIVSLLAEGHTNAQIAHHRKSSRRTVESHLSRVYQKLNIEGRVRLTVAAVEHFRPTTAKQFTSMPTTREAPME